MPLGPLLILGGLGIIGLFAATKSASAAPAGGGGAPPLPPAPAKASSDMPVDLQKEILTVLDRLTVNPETGVVMGPVTKEAVQAATALAGKLEALGFREAAKFVRDKANEASKRLPSPPKEKQVPLPPECFSAKEQESVNRLIQNERDPKKLQTVLDELEKRSKSVGDAACKRQIQMVVELLRTLIVQTTARQKEDEALRKVDEVLQTPPAPTTPAPSQNPRVVVVQKGEGLSQISKRLIGDGSRWPELRAANIPNDADGRGRQKSSSAAGITPGLQPGQKLFVPASWPAMPSVSVQAPVATPPASAQPTFTSVPAPPPVSLPAPSSGNPRVTVVQKGDGLSAIAKRLTGDGNRWQELRAANIPNDADGRRRSKSTTAAGITPGLQPGQKLFIPASWPEMASITVNAPLPAAPPPAATPTFISTTVSPNAGPSSGQRITIVQKGDGFARIAARLGMPSNFAELRDRNVPVSADGKARRSISLSQGGISPVLQPGDKLFVPEGWPSSAQALVMAGDIEIGRSAPEVGQVTAKSNAEILAGKLAAHLLRVQSRRPGPLGVNKQDKRLVSSFRIAAGLGDGVDVTPDVIARMQDLGVSELPEATA